jgi:uncharacterized protein YcbK (DUF882 family)
MLEWFKKIVENYIESKKVQELRDANTQLFTEKELYKKQVGVCKQDITDLEGKISLLESEKQNMANTIAELQKTQGQASNQFKKGDIELTYTRLNGKVETFMIDRNEQLTKNFKVREFLSPDTNKLILHELLVVIAQIVRDKYGKSITVTSGYRTVSHNKAVGGDPNSSHLQGKAMDFMVSGVNKNTVLAYVKTIPNIKYAYTNETNMKNAVHMNI